MSRSVPRPPGRSEHPFETEGRVQRLQALQMAGGDIEAARCMWTDYARQEFVAYLVATGDLNEWGHVTDGATDLETPARRAPRIPSEATP